jgi:hypothetical protein
LLRRKFKVFLFTLSWVVRNFPKNFVIFDTDQKNKKIWLNKV